MRRRPLRKGGRVAFGWVEVEKPNGSLTAISSAEEIGVWVARCGWRREGCASGGMAEALVCMTATVGNVEGESA